MNYILLTTVRRFFRNTFARSTPPEDSHSAFYSLWNLVMTTGGTIYAGLFTLAIFALVTGFVLTFMRLSYDRKTREESKKKLGALAFGAFGLSGISFFIGTIYSMFFFN